MFYGKEQKIETARRLKLLRNRYNNGEGISHEKLAGVLNEKYSSLEKDKRNDYMSSEKGEVISIGVLKNYEVTEFEHTKFNAGYGMSLSYLTMLADFYEVSVDYLLARTDEESPEDDVRGIHEKTGLSGPAIESIIKMNTDKTCVDAGLIYLLNKLLAYPEINVILYHVNLLRSDFINKLAYDEVVEEIGKWKAFELHMREEDGPLSYISICGFTTLTLDPDEYYEFRLIRLREQVADFIESFLSVETNDINLEALKNEMLLDLNYKASDEEGIKTELA